MRKLSKPFCRNGFTIAPHTAQRAPWAVRSSVPNQSQRVQATGEVLCVCCAIIAVSIGALDKTSEPSAVSLNRSSVLRNNRQPVVDAFGIVEANASLQERLSQC